MAYANKADQAASARRHYDANRQKIIDRAKAAKVELKTRNIALIRAAKAAPCADCAVNYPYYVMQFDHVRGVKDFNLGDHAHLSRSTKRVLAEMEKCDVVCANCHAERTHQRRVAEAGFEPA